MHIFTVSLYLIKSNEIRKRICLCKAIGFAAFPGHNAIRPKKMQIFVKNGQNHKLLAHCVENRFFHAIFAVREISMM